MNYSLTLTEQQKENPTLILKELAQDYTQSEMKEILWMWHKSAVNAEYAKLEREEKQLISSSFE
ncbi:MAG: hypothetical protein KGZ74_04620 [Chitinophagaceae bacterium]|nr:hypothetical protein [Chitinophagaceae bacterium]